MGQAKARGTFTERKAMAIERDKKIAAERARLRLEREATKSPEERKGNMNNKILLASLIAITESVKP